MKNTIKTYKIYALTTCPYCTRLIQALIDKKQTFYVEFLDGDPARLKSLKELYNHNTVPIVLLMEEKETLIGGCDDVLEKINKEKKC